MLAIGSLGGRRLTEVENAQLLCEPLITDDRLTVFAGMPEIEASSHE